MAYYSVTFHIEADKEDEVRQWAAERFKETAPGVEVKRYDIVEGEVGFPRGDGQ